MDVHDDRTFPGKLPGIRRVEKAGNSLAVEALPFNELRRGEGSSI